MKKGGRAAVIPLGEVNPPPAPLVGAEQGVLDRLPEAEATAKKRVFSPPYNPPRRPAHSAGPAKRALKIRPVFDQNFDRFLTSIFGRFGVVLGRQVGVILAPFGGQDRPRSLQNASWKHIFIKNVNFALVLRNPIPERPWGPQDGAQNAPRSAQDGSKRLLKRNFFALENRLKFGRVWGPILVDFGLPNPLQKKW